MRSRLSSESKRCNQGFSCRAEGRTEGTVRSSSCVSLGESGSHKEKPGSDQWCAGSRTQPPPESLLGRQPGPGFGLRSLRQNLRL